MRSVVPTDNAKERPPGASLRLLLQRSLVLAVALLSFGDCLFAEELLTRLRVRLEAPTEGELSVDGGRLEKLQPLSRDPNAAAATWLDGDVARWLHAPQPPVDAFDVTVRGEANAELVLRSSGDEELRIVVAEARGTSPDKPLVVQAGGTGRAVEITRYPADRLRVQCDRESLVFAPGESFEFEVLADVSEAGVGAPYDFVAALAQGRGGEELWRSETTRVDNAATPSRLPLSIPLPSQEGVYRVTLTATKPSGFRSRFLPGAQLLQPGERPLAERTFQVAVIDPKRRLMAPGGWLETYAYDPRTQRWADRVPEWMRWRRLPWFATGPLSSDGRSDRASLRDNAVEIAPAPSEGTAHWRAYPLPVDQPGATYAVEVETLGASGEELCVAVLEPDALGDLRPVSGCVTHAEPRWNRAADREPLRLLVRPRTTSPLLVLSNPNETLPARFGKVRLLKSSGAERPSASAERTVALDFVDPDLPHTLGASHVASPVGRFEQADLQTYLETASALADRVDAAGASGAIVTVNQNGAASYPSQLLGSPAYDLAVWADGAGDLPRRELIHVILKEFDRRGLRLTLAARFDAPIAGGTNRPDNRDARPEVFDELIERFGQSDAFAGVALRATPSGWGIDGGVTPEQAATANEALAARVAARTGAALFVFPDDLVVDPGVGAAVAPRLAGSTASAAALTSLQTLAAHAKVALPYGASSTRGSVGTPSSQVLQAGLRRALSSEAAAGAASFRATRRPLRLVQSAERLRSSNRTDDIVLPATMSDASAEGRFLAESASAAGFVVLSGRAPEGALDDAAIRQRRLLAQLPLKLPENDNARARSSDEDRDVVVDSYDTPQRGSVVVVSNHSVWKQQARVTVVAPHRVLGVRVESPQGNNSTTEAQAIDGQWFESGSHSVEVSLAPHETIAWRFSERGVTVEGLRIEPSAAAQRELAEGVESLQARDTTSRRPYEQIANASFERHEPSGEAATGWRLGGGISIDSTVAADGVASAKLTATPGAPATLETEAFPVPDTGQLVLGLQVLPGRLAEGGELLIEVEQVDGPYRNHAQLGAAQLNADEPVWRPIVFPIDDLPLIEGGRLRVRLTLTGDGHVRVDDLRPEDLLLPLDGYGAIDLRTERFAVVRLLQTAQNLLDEGRLEACRELLDSYWARFLIENFPRRDADQAVAEEAPEEEGEPVAAEEPAPEAPSLSERVRGYLWPWR